MDFSILLTPEVTQTILGIVSTALIYGIQKAASYFKTKTSNEKLDSALGVMDRLLTTAVKATEQTLKKDLIKETQGKLTPLQQKHLRDNVVNTVMTNLADSAKKEILKAIPDIHTYAFNKVEDIVHDIKISSKKPDTQNKFGLNSK